MSDITLDSPRLESHGEPVYLIADGKPSIDYSLYVLKEIASVLDERLSEIERQIQSGAEADWFGDTAEGLCGVGFVACQQYLTATASWVDVAKSTALGCGPIHPCGNTIASIVNHAANYWKHSDEWSHETSKSQQARTQDGLEAILADFENGYPLTVILARLVFPSKNWRFGELIPRLTDWRDDLHARFPRA